MFVCNKLINKFCRLIKSKNLKSKVKGIGNKVNNTDVNRTKDIVRLSYLRLEASEATNPENLACSTLFLVSISVELVLDQSSHRGQINIFRMSSTPPEKTNKNALLFIEAKKRGGEIKKRGNVALIDIRKDLWYFACGNGGNQLAPDQGTNAKKDAPRPLRNSQRGCRECLSTILHNHNLKNEDKISA